MRIVFGLVAATRSTTATITTTTIAILTNMAGLTGGRSFAQSLYNEMRDKGFRDLQKKQRPEFSEGTPAVVNRLLCLRLLNTGQEN
jgi:hypothetical protein